MDRKSMIRLCHLCNCVNESEQEEVLRCKSCGKGFLPVNYFEKIRKRAIASGQITEELPEFPFNPLNGLLVFW